MKLVVGLGNPGPKYAKVRHNLGWMVLDELVDDWEENKKLKSLISKKEDLIFAKPLTFMNNSGLAVKLLTTYYRLPATDLIVIHDDLDLPLGKIKIRKGGAAAGHHGVESIIKALDTDQFTRVRLGIGNLRTQSSEHKHAHVDTNKFVLEPFLHSEKAKVKHMIKQAVKAVELLLEKDLAIAQNQYN
ncbi:aminoacyl-tRNA hydrolase [Candidatus Daviesbacteria bacterium]|nr:aminoacyl-tRNA hydrolase [Candidatus Daviesbacteria bacterium]MBI3109416.1 aminoacyl-tRNA hydrolase [Candidatus Daviesbacteria bacterium]